MRGLPRRASQNVKCVVGSDAGMYEACAMNGVVHLGTWRAWTFVARHAGDGQGKGW